MFSQMLAQSLMLSVCGYVSLSVSKTFLISLLSLEMISLGILLNLLSHFAISGVYKFLTFLVVLVCDSALGLTVYLISGGSDSTW